MRVITTDTTIYVSFPSDIAGRDAQVALPAGESFLVTDWMAQSIHTTKLGKHIVKDVKWNPEGKPYRGQDLEGKKLHVIRTGGFGDLLFITPLIKHLSLKYGCEITFSTLIKHMSALRGNPYLKNIFPLPTPMKVIDQADYVLHFEGTIEGSKDPDLHAVDIFAKRAGLELDDSEKLPVFRLPSKARQFGKAFLRDRLKIVRRKKKIAIQAKSSSMIRNYPAHLLAEVCRGLANEGFEIVMLGGERQFPRECEDIRKVHNLCGRMKSIIQSIGVMSQCDCLIAPDSSLVHFAAAIDLPTVALYGPFPGKIRTAYYKHCVTLEPVTQDHTEPCVMMPCMIHSSQPCPKARERKLNYSPCFEHLEPSRVIAAVKQQFLKKKERGRSYVR